MHAEASSSVSSQNVVRFLNHSSCFARDKYRSIFHGNFHCVTKMAAQLPLQRGCAQLPLERGCMHLHLDGLHAAPLEGLDISPLRTAACSSLRGAVVVQSKRS